MLQSWYRVISAIERSINESEIHDLMEDLSEMTHHVSHDLGVSVVAMEA